MPCMASVTMSSTSLISFFTSAPRERARGGASCLLLLPVARPLDRLLPPGAARRPLLGAPAGLPRPVDLPVAAELVQAVPEPDRQPGGVGGAEGRRLADRRPHHGRAQDIRLEL